MTTYCCEIIECPACKGGLWRFVMMSYTTYGRANTFGGAESLYSDGSGHRRMKQSRFILCTHCDTIFKMKDSLNTWTLDPGYLLFPDGPPDEDNIPF